MTTAGPDMVVRRGDVLWRGVVDGVLIRRRGNDEEVLLAGSGVALWAELATAMRVDDLIGRLADSHGSTPDLVAADVMRTLDDLISRGVVAHG